MLRHLGQHGGGVRVYTENLLREVLALETPHRFILLYADPRMLGRYAGPAVEEIVVRAPHALLWDQLAARRAARRADLDVLFNPKYSIPLRTRCPTVFVCHGLDWYVMPWASKPLDRISHRHLMPRYARRAAAVVAVSETTRRQVVEYLGVAPSRVHTVHHGVDERFRAPVPEEHLRAVRARRGLPERFFLYCGQIYPPKNFGRLLQAYARVGPELGVSLVVAGEHRWLSEDELALVQRLRLEPWILWAGWIEHEELPAVYALADALCLPSLYESFGLPLIEAMAAGCPVVTANRYGTRELADRAGILVDPESVESIARGLRRVATDAALRGTLRDLGRERARSFSWTRCARETLDVIEAAGRSPPPAGSLRPRTAAGAAS
jgi:glycosyltransferase involved in cell wall biosynthesis